MIPPAGDLLAAITDGPLLAAEEISALDHDAILDLRDDSPEFEGEWSRCLDEIERRWSESAVAANAAQICEEIRKQSFLKVSRATGQHEIASYVSDDFDLIARASVLEFDDPFIAGMWSDYQRGVVPHPTGA